MTETRRLGRTDIEITPVGLGCWQLAGRGPAGWVYPAIGVETATAIVRAAIEGGVNWFDTAEMYGGGQSERTLASALRDAGIEPWRVVIATKWNPLFLRSAASISRTFGARTEALQGYPIDLHQIHMPWGSLSTHKAQLREMAGLLRARKIRAIGVSGFSAQQMTEASDLLAAEGMVLASNQVEISLVQRKIERDGVLAAARKLGVTLIAFSPLRSGLLTGRFHDDPGAVASLPRMRRMLGLGSYSAVSLAKTRPLIDELGRIAAAYSVSRAQVALNWLISFYGETVVAIPGASRLEQAVESAAAMSFRLTDPELARLDELSRQT